MTEFRVTFGQQYGAEEYGADPHPVLGYQFAHKDGWISILAPDQDAARELTEQLLGTRWSNIYDAREIEDWDWKFPRGELLRLIHPGMRDLSVALLRGAAPIPLVGGGEYLVTVWGNGTGEYAWRATTGDSWGPPVPLQPAHRGAGA